MSIFRLIRGEMQKILLRPLLYFITIALVVALLGSVFLFNSVNTSKTGYVVPGADKTEVMNSFLSGSAMNKNIANEDMKDAQTTIDYYATLNSVPAETITARLKTQTTAMRGELQVYINNIQATAADSTDLIGLEANRQTLIAGSAEIKSIISSTVQGARPSVLISKADFDNYIGLISSCYNILNASIDTNNLSDHKLIVEKLQNPIGYSNIAGKSYFDKLSKLNNSSIVDVVVNAEVITSLKTNHATASTYLTKLNEKIVAAPSDEKVSLEDMKDYVLSYFYTALQMKNLATDSVKYYPVSDFSDYQINQLIGYKDINSYMLRQEIERNDYMIAHNLSQNNCANVFNPAHSFGESTSALDLVYFGLEICGLIVAIICMVLVAGMIAGEREKGTLKMLAVRPYSRRQILSSKIITSLLFGVILLLFSALILFVAGGLIFGIDSTPVLAVFNASCSFLISPFLLILIYFVLLVFKILFYTLFAAMIAVVFKNNIAAIVIPLLFYLTNAIFSFLFAGSYWYAYTPFACVDLFKFFGGGVGVGQNPLAMCLSSPILYNSSFIYSIIISVALVALMIFINHLTFKKQEIR